MDRFSVGFRVLPPSGRSPAVTPVIAFSRRCLKTVIPRSGTTRNLVRGSSLAAWTQHPRPLASLGVTFSGVLLRQDPLSRPTGNRAFRVAQPGSGLPSSPALPPGKRPPRDGPFSPKLEPRGRAGWMTGRLEDQTPRSIRPRPLRDLRHAAKRRGDFLIELLPWVRLLGPPRRG